MSKDNQHIIKASGYAGVSLACFLAVMSVIDAQDKDTEIIPGTGITIENALRKFDGLCTIDPSSDDKSTLKARFLPSVIDYNTKLTPNSPVTEGEHVREQLIRSHEDVSGFIDKVDASGIKNRFVLLQKAEMLKAQKEFNKLSKQDVVSQENMKLCSAPFPKP